MSTKQEKRTRQMAYLFADLLENDPEIKEVSESGFQGILKMIDARTDITEEEKTTMKREIANEIADGMSRLAELQQQHELLLLNAARK